MTSTEVLEFDHLIVGGATVGGVVAAQPSEDPAVTVGILEWGPTDLDYWRVPQERGNSNIGQTRARILGGCSVGERAAQLIQEDAA